MVRAADDLKEQLAALPGDGVQVSLTGASGMWSDFNEANKTAMMKSELISWPVTLGILLLAFGSLVAAGLPLMLTILGLVASAGSLYLGTQILDISIWAMNFALMFALALGIDYALFIVYRFRGAFFGSEEPVEEAVAETMDTAGKAVLFSGLTVLISLSAVMLVPSPAFRSMALGIMLSVVFILAATLTLLPAVLAKLGPRVDKLSLPWVHSGEHRSPRFAAWGERLWRRPLAYGAVARRRPGRADHPRVRPADRHAVDQGRARGRRLARRLHAGAGRVRHGRARRAAGRRAEGRRRAGRRGRAKADPGVAQVMPAVPGRGGQRDGPGRPRAGPVRPGRRRDDRPPARPTCRDGALVGGSVAENHDLEAGARPRRPRWSSASCSRSASCCCSSRCRRRSSPPSAWSPTCSPSAPRSASPG